MTLRVAARLPAAALSFILAGLAARFAGSPVWAERVWGAGLILTGAPIVWGTLRGLAAGRFAADLVAMLAIVVAVILREPLPGLIIVLMQSGGEALEDYARGRASKAVQDLEAAAPRIAHRVTSDGTEDVPAETIAVGELLLVRPGELVPCDSTVVSGRSHVDTAHLTGEPIPVRAEVGTRLASGSHNLEGPLTVRAAAVARESQYARIVDLVREAQASKAPLQRLADRYAVWFTPFTLAACLVAYLASHDPTRVLAVLVVATPCPLLLAAPVAVVGGINRAARRQVIFRHGTALEQLGTVTIGVFDKTGTLTIGRPRVARVIAAPPFSEAEVLRLAAAVEHGSSHLLARTLVEEATARGIPIAEAHGVVETPGQGVVGEVDGRAVAVGGWAFIASRFSRAEPALASIQPDGAGLRAYVAVEGCGAGIVEYADALRPGLQAFFNELHRLGIRRTVLLSGDAQANAEAVARAMGIDDVQGDLTPDAKVARVHSLMKAGERVLMVGDGTNDAPALSTATVGIAIASGGGGITAEAADAVVLTDDPTRVADAIAISRRTMRIARQSIGVGLGLSGLAMVVAAAGHIPPTAGAVLQELIDVTVILNALRSAGETPKNPS